MSGLLVLNTRAVVADLGDGGLDLTVVGIGGLTAAVLTTCLYVLLIAAFLRRSQAKATHPSRPAAAAAMVATWLPFAIPLVPHGSPSMVALVLANALLIAGLGFSVWSIRYLDRSFSMVAQARAVVRTGPYALVRHPLYAGELVALLGTVLTRPGVWGLTIWATVLGLQVYRARHEEAILSAVLIDYRDYQRTTPQLVPYRISDTLRRLIGSRPAA